MIKLEDYSNPFNAIRDFEQEICKFTGAPYCVTTNACSHAIEIAFRLAHNGTKIYFPACTYISVPMTFKKICQSYELVDRVWQNYYQFDNSNIWDYARHFEKDMYVSGQIQCVSFGRTKPLEIGFGGCLLTDDLQLYQRASRMRSDGRDLFRYQNWEDQDEFELGFHYTLRPEECVIGLNKLISGQFTEQLDKYFKYPDCRKIKFLNH